MPRITISYRRDDSVAITGRIFDRLVARYGRDAVFRDIDDVPFGVDFRTHIEEVLSASDVVIAVVGPHWAGPSASQSRLSNEADPVRVEIETALGRKLPLIPVLVLGAAMPSVTQLPENLKDFAYRNAVELDAGQNFDVGMGRLIRAVDGILRRGAPPGRATSGAAAVVSGRDRPTDWRLVIGSLAAAFLVAASLAGWYFGFEQQRPSTKGAGTGTVTATNPAASTSSPAIAPPPAPAAVVAAPSTSPPPIVAAPAPSIDAEMLFWQSISASNNAADFEEYLRKYPSGQFAGLARNRFASLSPPKDQAIKSRPRDINFLTGAWCQITKLEGDQYTKLTFRVFTPTQIIEEYSTKIAWTEMVQREGPYQKLLKFINNSEIELIHDDARLKQYIGKETALYEIINDDQIKQVNFYDIKGTSLLFRRCN